MRVRKFFQFLQHSFPVFINESVSWWSEPWVLSSSVGVTSGIVIVAFLSFQTSNSDLTCTTNRAPLLFYFPKNHSLRELSYYSPHLTQAPSKSPVSPYFSDPMDYLNFRRGARCARTHQAFCSGIKCLHQSLLEVNIAIATDCDHAYICCMDMQ